MLRKILNQYQLSNSSKSKRWPLYLKNWASYSNFRRSRYNNISLSQNFQISISQWVFEIGVWFFACDHNFYIFQNNFQQYGSYSAPSFISGGVGPPLANTPESEMSPLIGLKRKGNFCGPDSKTALYSSPWPHKIDDYDWLWIISRDCSIVPDITRIIDLQIFIIFITNLVLLANTQDLMQSELNLCKSLLPRPLQNLPRIHSCAVKPWGGVSYFHPDLYTFFHLQFHWGIFFK